MTITEEPVHFPGPVGTALKPATPPRPQASLSPLALLDLLQDYVDETGSVLPLAPADLDERRYELLELTDDFEIWAIHWPQGHGLELHDHGGAAGALWVVEGSLKEHYIRTGPAGGGVARRTIALGGGAAFGPSYVHDVVNVLAAPATSVHAYSPPMESMTFYRHDGRRLEVDRAEYRADPRGHRERRRTHAGTGAAGTCAGSTPGRPRDPRTRAACWSTSVRRRSAPISADPGALVVERNNFEWRLDPGGSHRLAEAEDPTAPWWSSARRATPPAWPRPASSNLGRTAVSDLDGGFVAGSRPDTRRRRLPAPPLAGPP